MNHKTLKAALFLAMSTMTSNAMAADSLKHASNASKHSAKAVAELAKSGVKVSAAVVSVPLIVVGSVGVASAAAGSSAINYAIGQDGELPIGDEVVVAGPSPKQAIKEEQK